MKSTLFAGSRLLSSAPWLLLLGAALSSCTGYGDSCSSSGDCLGGLVCTDGVCRTKEYNDGSNSSLSGNKGSGNNGSSGNQCSQASSLCSGYYNQCASNPLSQAPCYCAAACVCHHCGESCEATNRSSAAQLGTQCSY